MSTQGCWQVLGIAPTPDEREVRRAYAKLLKTTRPEDDADAFQRLRAAFEEALWAADALRKVPPPDEEQETGARNATEAEWEQRLRPYVEQLAQLNEQGTYEETLAVFNGVLDTFGLRDEASRDPVGWELLEDGMLWVCCDISANHDEFLRMAIELFGWTKPGHWLAERDPRTVEWLRLRMVEAEALVMVDRLLDLVERGDEADAVTLLGSLIDEDLLCHVDVRHLFEAELMVGISELPTLPMQLSEQAFRLFAWRRDHRHLEEYHPDAWRQYQSRLLQTNANWFLLQ